MYLEVSVALAGVVLSSRCWATSLFFPMGAAVSLRPQAEKEETTLESVRPSVIFRGWKGLFQCLILFFCTNYYCSILNN